MVKAEILYGDRPPLVFYCPICNEIRIAVEEIFERCPACNSPINITGSLCGISTEGIQIIYRMVIKIKEQYPDYRGSRT